MTTHKLEMSEKIGGEPHQYIKVKEIEKSPDGIHFSFVYMDDGKFRLRIIGKQTKTAEEIEK